MSDPTDRYLEERLHAIARGVVAPVVPPGDDVRRGRRRLLRMRVAMAGGTTATLAAVVGVTSLTAGAPRATEIAPASHLPTVQPTTPTTPTTPAIPGPSAAPGTQPTTPSAGGQPNDTGARLRAAAGLPAGGPGGGAGTPAAGGVLPPDQSQVKGAQTQAAATGAVPGQHLLSPAGEASGPPITSGLPSDSPTGAATELPTPSDPTTATTPPQPPPTGGTESGMDRVVAVYNAVVAEHLDPGREHLQPYDPSVDHKATRKIHGMLLALRSTFRWVDGPARSELQVTVASGWDQVDWDCGATYSDWACHAADSGAGRAEVATHDGLREVAVEHGTGQVVVITAEDGDSSEAALVAAARDDRLVLPRPAAQAPPALDSAAFASAGEAALVMGHESFGQTALDRSPFVRGTWSDDDGNGGTVAWWARPVYSAGTFSCRATYLTCFSAVVDEAGTTVHVALLRGQAGWVVRYDGPSYAVRVWSSDPTFPKRRAVVFVTDDAWQPVRP